MTCLVRCECSFTHICSPLDCPPVHVRGGACSFYKQWMPKLNREQERKGKANELKTKGNKSYTDRKFLEAVKLYTRAIQISPTPDPVYFSNRAACVSRFPDLNSKPSFPSIGYMYYEKPEYEKAVEDCTAALNIDKMHVRSLNRRGTAYEKMGKLKEALKGTSSFLST